MTIVNQEAIDKAVADYDKAVAAQVDAKTNLDNLTTSLTTWRKAFEDAKKVLDQAKPAITVAKAQLQKADADVTLAKAALAALAPEKVATTNGKGADQGKVQAAVRAIMLAAAPNGLTLDEVYNRLVADGITMGGAKPRENLGAYLSRWSKVPEFGVENRGRGVWGATMAAEAPEVPSFLAPEPAADVPAFLTPPNQGQVTIEVGAALPEGFPGRAALLEAGLNTVESLTDKTHDQLRRIKGVGAETARSILAALNPEA